MNEGLLLLFEKTCKLAETQPTAPYEQFEELIELRETVIQQLQQQDVISETDKMYIKRIAQMDADINNHMRELRDAAAFELKRLEDKKKQRSGYDSNPISDSYFIDYRK
ncbi:hypothetical protein PAT3040_01748 [Paenibacillus agaridevorans]|uniref:Flagellar protein FliT n=1 Tax=Paenibacillus agaridevorans TaxID=171404 RepID=A0A2R5EKN2_9BACL|nr:hypothetical protein [Paenibacillus agaridevorans]GBG07200.1 hypothetical protein PAT3040_01748 [Paenibacillus agaridevorans]